MLLLTSTVGSNGMFFKFSHSSLSYTALVTVCVCNDRKVLESVK